MAHTYSHLFQLPTTGLRFFTVYGPWGRPDMAVFKFTKAILEGKPIDIYNDGRMKRDFTYIDDIVDGIIGVIPKIPQADPLNPQTTPASARAPYRLYNIGHNQPVELMRLIEILENTLGKKAIKNFLPMQPGDVMETYADIDKLKAFAGFEPHISIEDGIARFVEWYKEYYAIAVV